MKVFLSWSGERSRGLALAFRDWLPLVLHYVEPWLSDTDIDAGERWAQSVANELATSHFGILCVTSENVSSPWVLFEAGALAKSMESSKVIPLLLDLEFSDISGPLAQFQAKKLTRVNIEEVIHSIQNAADESIPEVRATQLFAALWSELESKLSEIPDVPPTDRHIRPQNEILEELVAGVRALDSRLHGLEYTESDERKRIRHPRGIEKIHPFAMREIAHRISDDPQDPVIVLLISSMFIDDVPWLYELGLNAFHSIKMGGSPGYHVSAVNKVLRALHLLARGPLGREELGIDPRKLDIAFHELERYVNELGESELNSDNPDDDR